MPIITHAYIPSNEKLNEKFVACGTLKMASKSSTSNAMSLAASPCFETCSPISAIPQ